MIRKTYIIPSRSIKSVCSAICPFSPPKSTFSINSYNWNSCLHFFPSSVKSLVMWWRGSVIVRTNSIFLAIYDQCSLGDRDAAGIFPLDSGPILCENNLEVFTQKRAIVAVNIAAWGEAIRRLITVESGLKRWLRGCFLCMLPSDEMYTMVVGMGQARYCWCKGDNNEQQSKQCTEKWK